MRKEWWLIEFWDCGAEVLFDPFHLFGPFQATREEVVRCAWEWLFDMAQMYSDLYGYGAGGVNGEWFWVVGGESSDRVRYKHFLRLVRLTRREARALLAEHAGGEEALK